ncbi:hypothetical protein D3C72_1294970 [compost metagenome]
MGDAPLLPTVVEIGLVPAQPRGEIVAFDPQIGHLVDASSPEVIEHGAHRPLVIVTNGRKPGVLAHHQHQLLLERRHGGVVQIVEGKQDDAVHPAPLQHGQVFAHLGGGELALHQHGVVAAGVEGLQHAAHRLVLRAGVEA